MLTIGDKIKAIRKENGLTQKEFAKKLNKSERMIQKYENSEVEPKLEILKEISIELDVSISDLINSNITDKNRFLSILKSKKITIQQLSKELEIPIDTINEYINNKELVTKSEFETLYKITDYLGINSDYILNRTDFKFFEDHEINTFKLIFDAIKNNTSDDIKIMSRDILELLFLTLYNPISGEYIKLLDILKETLDTLYKLNNKLANTSYERFYLKDPSLKKSLPSDELISSKEILNYKKIFSKCVDELVKYYSNPNIMSQEISEKIDRELELKFNHPFDEKEEE